MLSPKKLLLAVSLLLPACGKSPEAPKPGQKPAAPVAASAWPTTSSGPLWEALPRVPAGFCGIAGTADYAGTRAGHPEYSEPRHDRSMDEFERGVAARIAIKPEEVQAFVWAEIQSGRESDRDTYLMARLSVPVERIRTALHAAAFERAAGEDEIWSPTLEKDKFVPERILLKDGWLVRTLCGDAAIGRLIRTWAGKDPNARSVPHAPELLATLPPSLPAVLRFGIEEQPLPDSPLRVVAMAMAPDASTGEDVVTVAFNDEKGPDQMQASAIWKRQMATLTIPPVIDRSGRYLRVRTNPDADPLRREQQRRTASDTVDGLRRAISEFEVDVARFPARLEELWTGEGRPYSGPVRNDPWGHPYLYRCPPPSGNEPYDLRSMGPDGKPDTPDDIH